MRFEPNYTSSGSTSLQAGWGLFYHNLYATDFKIQGFNPLTAGAVHIRFLHFILPHYILAFKPGQDKNLY